MTNRTCCLLTFLPGSYDLHHRTVMQELNMRPEGMVTDGTRYKRMLTAMGRNVDKTAKEFTFRHDLSAEPVLRQFSTCFGIFGMEESDAVAYLKGYLNRSGENGVLHDESKLRYALLNWNEN